MKNKFLFLILICIVFTNCKNDSKKQEDKVSQETIEKNEMEHTLKTLQGAVLEDMDRLKFKKEVFPLVAKLNSLDASYKMINIIASKLIKETSPEAFRLGFQNFKDELNKTKAGQFK